MKKTILILLMLACFASYGQKKGRAISAVKIDVGKLSIVDYDTNTDSLNVVEDGISFKTYIPQGSVDYINGSSFNTGTGLLSLTGVGLAGTSENLDGRYGILSSTNTWTATNRFNSTLNLYLGSTFGGQIFTTALGLTIDAATNKRLQLNGGKNVIIQDDGIYADLDAATSTNVVYRQADGELTYGAASSGGSIQTKSISLPGSGLTTSKLTPDVSASELGYTADVTIQYYGTNGTFIGLVKLVGSVVYNNGSPSVNYSTIYTSSPANITTSLILSGSALWSSTSSSTGSFLGINITYFTNE